MLDEQTAEFLEAVQHGEIAFDAGRPGGGFPPVLSALHSRRLDRELWLLRNAPDGDPSLYGPEPESAAACALRGLLWATRFAPDLPVRLTPSETGMLRATYALPDQVTVTHLLLFDRLSSDDRTVTGSSLVEAMRAASWSAGNAVTGEGLAIAEEKLEPSPAGAPGPLSPPERTATERVLEVPLDYFSDFTPRLIPRTPGSADDVVPMPAVTHSGQVRTVMVLASTVSAIGWLAPFSTPEIDPYEGVFVGLGRNELYWWGNKTGLRTPRPR